ncbi:MAG TPA: CoA-transferase [Acidimicrobiia bacterium]|nr:CoA-transferase [Acidimicrobiia bacterium]
MSAVRRADVCAVALAEVFRGDGEILANPIGNLPMIGGRLARETFEPDLVMTDGEALLVQNAVPIGAAADSAPKVVEAWNPYRAMFDIVWSGRRHIIMGPVQIDRHGNANIAWIGDDAQRPARQFLGFRGGPGNTISHATSYWVPNHSPRVFVEKVDVVVGVGYDRAAALGAAGADHAIPRVVSNLGVFDFETDDRSMRLRSVHPGVTVDDVRGATGFVLAIASDVDETRVPTAEEQGIIDAVDPAGLRYREVPDP